VRKFIVITTIVLGFLSFPSPALAHGDVRLVDEVVRLEPGESAQFDGDLHYHRLVGRISADGPVVVRLINVDGESVALSRGPGAELSFNDLIRCCDDRAWTPHRLVIENPGDDPVTVEARARLVHDDLAVMVYGAEAGTRESIVVMGAIWIAVLWRGTRWRRAMLPMRWPLLASVGLAAGVGALGLYGAVRYGIGGAPALVAALGDIPVLPVNAIVSRASLVMLVAMVGWALAGYWWARARPSASKPLWVALGLALAGMVALTALLIASAYEATGVPVAMALAAIVPLLVVIGLELRRKARARPVVG
jgi:hypothetical protein